MKMTAPFRLFLVSCLLYAATAFVVVRQQVTARPVTMNPEVTAIVRENGSSVTLFMATGENKADDGVVELVDEEIAETQENEASQVAPFLSQGEISEDATNPDLSDPKQTRVILYTIISLLPVLFLIPLMLGSRDLIPAEMLPPVEM